MEMISRTKKFDEAIKRLSLIGVDNEMVIEPFKKGTLRLSEYVDDVFNALLYDVSQYSDLVDYINNFERKNNALVYHVQLTHLVFGDLFSLFYVSDYEDEWEMDRDALMEGVAMVYVWNKSDDLCSEFGYINFKTSIGGIVRTA